MIVATPRGERRVTVTKGAGQPAPFTGSYAYGVDRKGRVVVPSHWLPRLGSPFILCRAPEGRLYLMPRGYWDALQARHGGHPVFREFFTAGAVECTVDRSTRRVLVPPLLREHAGLRPYEDVILAGLGQLVALERHSEWKARLAAAEDALSRPQWRPALPGPAMPALLAPEYER